MEHFWASGEYPRGWGPDKAVLRF